MDIAKIFLTQMFADNLESARAMLAVGNLAMARAELKNAAEKLDQIEDLAKAFRPAPKVGNGPKPTTPVIEI